MFSVAVRRSVSGIVEDVFSSIGDVDSHSSDV